MMVEIKDKYFRVTYLHAYYNGYGVSALDHRVWIQHGNKEQGLTAAKDGFFSEDLKGSWHFIPASAVLSVASCDERGHDV